MDRPFASDTSYLVTQKQRRETELTAAQARQANQLPQTVIVGARREALIAHLSQEVMDGEGLGHVGH